jgi:hypothetical protein
VVAALNPQKVNLVILKAVRQVVGVLLLIILCVGVYSCAETPPAHAQGGPVRRGLGTSWLSSNQRAEITEKAAATRWSNNWLWVFQGGRIWPQAAAVLGFRPAPSNPVRSSFLEGQNGWKPRWASDSHAIGAGAV